jgi:GAF domain-containing protein
MNSTSAPLPTSEAKRLKVLWQYDLLDTLPEAVFDDLTELAARICEAPIAMISLIDEKRQWFKAKVGTTMTETSRDISFCAHAILQPDLFIVRDALLDPRFAQNPMVVSEPKIRFYAGAPLVTADGYALGTLCIIDKVPRDLREEQKQALKILARHVVSQLELRRRTQELATVKEEQKRLRAEIAKARSALSKAKRPAPKTRPARKASARKRN